MAYNLNTASLMHFIGADGSTTFNDETKRVWSLAQDAQIDTAKSKFNGSCLLLDGTGDYIETPYVLADFDWWTDDFTIDMWIWINAATTLTEPCNIGNMNPATPEQYWGFGQVTGNYLRFKYYNGSAIHVTSSGTIPTGEWAHIRMTQTGSHIYLFINGVLDGDAAISGTPQSSTSVNLVMGALNSVYFNGWTDEFTILMGECLSTTDFDVPTAPYANPRAIGGTVEVDGEYTIHTFLADDDFIANEPITAEVLVVAGGGGGGGAGNSSSRGAGGGGAGGRIIETAFLLAQDTHAVVIGGGGAGGVAGLTFGTDGSDSSISTLVADGGGGGAPQSNDGRDGGSGGGSGNLGAGGGTGTAGQGYDGGTGAANIAGGSGGGGATGAGQIGIESGSGGAGGAGGTGYLYNGTTYAAGGDGGSYSYTGAAVDASSNTGDGGEGGAGRPDAAWNLGGAGGSGIVIIRYLITVAVSGGMPLVSPYFIV